MLSIRAHARRSRCSLRCGHARSSTRVSAPQVLRAVKICAQQRRYGDGTTHAAARVARERERALAPCFTRGEHIRYEENGQYARSMRSTVCYAIAVSGTRRREYKYMSGARWMSAILYVRDVVTRQECCLCFAHGRSALAILRRSAVMKCCRGSFVVVRLYVDGGGYFLLLLLSSLLFFHYFH